MATWDTTGVQSIDSAQFNLAASLADASPAILLALVCDRGQKVDPEIRGCLDCPPGTYQPLPAGNLNRTWDCISCPQAKSTINETGATSASQCVCKQGSWRDASEGCWRRGYFESHSECFVCPKGANCSGMSNHGMRVEELSPLAGFWRPYNTSLNFTDCRVGYRGIHGTEYAKARCAPRGSAKGERCAHGYNGPLCMTCSPGFTRVRDDCQICGEGNIRVADVSAKDILLYIVLPVCGLYYVVILLLSCCTYVRAHRHSLRSVEDSGDSPCAQNCRQITEQVVILISWAQIVSLVPVTFDSVPWPKMYVDFAFGVSIVNFDITDFVSGIDCSLSLEYLTRLQAHMCVPVIIIAVSKLAQLTLWLIAKCSRCACDHCTRNSLATLKAFADVDATMYTLLLLIHPSLSQRLFTIFDCQAIAGIANDGDPIHFLARDFNIKCYSDEHMDVVWQVVGTIAIFCVGVPVMLLWDLYRNRKDLHEEDAATTLSRTPSKNHDRHVLTEHRLGNLYKSYETSYWWMEVAILYYKVFLTGVLTVIAPGSPIQLLVALIVCFGFLVAISHLAPYTGDDADVLSFLCTISLCFTILDGFFESSFNM
jgi:hypothetical protein